MWSMTAARSGPARASAWPAARSWRSDAASDIRGSTPASSTVAAASAISSERRRPCSSEREMKYVATACQSAGGRMFDSESSTSFSTP